jgi:hypothetical protein
MIAFGQDAIRYLSPLKKITIIELMSPLKKREMEEKQLDHSPVFKSYMNDAKNALRQQSGVNGQKLLKIRYGYYATDPVDEIEVE